MTMLPVADRALLALEALAVAGERRGLITDSNVLDVIEEHATEQCTQGCVSGECCDMQRLAVLVWGAVESGLA